MTVQELLDKHNIYYRSSGQDFLIHCLNPEHDDSNPSLRVDRVLGIFNCLSCGYKGNIFYLYDEKFDKTGALKEQIKRKIDTIRAESIGLKIPDDAMFLEEGYRVQESILAEFEAFRTFKIKELNGRIVFPVRDMKQRISCFIARAEDRFETPKYKFYPSGSTVPFFPLYKLKPIQGRVLLVEGIFDYLNLYQYGFENVLCIFGTNKVTEKSLELLKVLGIWGIDIMLDPDDRGQEAAAKIKELVEKSDFAVRNINLKSCDPGELTEKRAVNLKAKLYKE